MLLSVTMIKSVDADIMNSLGVCLCPSGYGRAPSDFFHHDSGGSGFDCRDGHGQPSRLYLRVGKLVAISRQVGDHCGLLL